MKRKRKGKGKPEVMPREFPDDHLHVLWLLDEARRCNALGERWRASKPSNPIAVEHLFSNGWAYTLAAAWLRCRLKGEVGPHLMDPKPKSKKTR